MYAEYCTHTLSECHLYSCHVHAVTALIITFPDPSSNLFFCGYEVIMMKSMV